MFCFKRAGVVAAVACSWVAGFGSPAEASTVLHLDLPQMCARADAIVNGEVVATKASFDESQRRIWTEVRVRVDEGIHGAAAGELVVLRYPGGIADGVGQKVHGTPEMVKGERAFFFLERDRQRAVFRLVGMAQGMLHLASQPDGSVLATQKLEGLAFARKEGRRPIPLEAGSVTPLQLPLTKLRARVRAELKALGR